MLSDRERYVRCLLGQDVDRLPYVLHWGPWPTAWQRWQREGKPEAVTDARSFMAPDSGPVTVPVMCGPCPRVPNVVIAEDEQSRTWIDSWGITRRDTKLGESMPTFVSFPITTRDDWHAYKALRMDPHHPDRLAGGWRELCADWMARDLPIQLGGYPDGLYGAVRWLLGDEECLVAFYDDPELVHDMMDTMTDIYLAVFGAVVEAGVRVSIIHIWEDMCGKQGPLISPAHWREFMGPGYRRIKAFAEQHGIPLLSVDTDGQPRDIMAPMLEAGVNYLFPIEVAAGCDINDYRRQWPEMGMMGGIDKRALAVGPEAIETELDRIWPATEAGGYIPDLDHLVPDDVSWANYSYYCAALRRRVMGG